MAFVQHALKDRIGIIFAARRAQGVFIIHPSKDDDFGFRIESEEKPKSSANLCPAPVPKCGTHGVALAVFLPVWIAGHSLEDQPRQGIEQPHVGIGIKTVRVLLLGALRGSMEFLQLRRYTRMKEQGPPVALNHSATSPSISAPR